MRFFDGKIQTSPGMAAMALAAVMILAPSCTNSGSGRSPNSSTSTSTGSDDSSDADGALQISTVTISSSSSDSSAGTTSTSSSSSSAFTVSIFFTASDDDSISSYCGTSSGATNACRCKFSWEEMNVTTGDAIPIGRLVYSDISSVQNNLITCPAPSVYDSEISEDTIIKITIVPSTSSSESFSIDPYSYTKSGAVEAGSFQDAEGRAFDNIHRYGCYEQYQRGMKVQSKLYTVTDPNGEEGSITFPIASQFCIAKASGSSSSSTGCETLPAAENSAQAYYYNLYIRNTDRGGINEQNERYVCPKVKEVLNDSGTVGSEGQYWPMDASFALALSPSSDYSIAVEGPSRLSIGEGDSSTANSTCYTTEGAAAAGSGDASSIVSTCLGFALKPNTDGTCPYFTDSGGSIRLTYRLRRFYALYPNVFDSNGQPIAQYPGLDVIYVLDRPVSYSSADPLKPYTMRGPKPCPFAYFDHKGVLTEPTAEYPDGMPGYAATNYSGWNGTNIDGIQFPNEDIKGQSCSAVLPLYNSDTNVMSLATLNELNPVRKVAYIRPVRAWAPHYEEDTSFEACAPQSSPVIDPPLHFAKDSTNGNVAWCAEAYPTQNDNLQNVEQRLGGSGSYAGYVMPYTSHVVKNSASTSCVATSMSAIPTDYPAKPAAAACSTTNSSTYAAAHHPQNILIDSWFDKDSSAKTGCANATCDRTVQNAGLSWTKFPLIARAPQVEAALISDTTYGCIMTYDNDGGKAGQKSPSAGCCGTNVHVETGLSSSSDATSAHLEPDVPCLTPTY